MRSQPAAHEVRGLKDDAPAPIRVRNVSIPMRDGVNLAADLFAPAEFSIVGGHTRYPVLIEFTPYRKDDVPGIPTASFLGFPAMHGYVVACVDVRGTGSSEGVMLDEYSLQEQSDVLEAIDWFAQQRWCDGSVALVGSSYSAFVALQAATHSPESLACVIAYYGTDDRYTDDCHYWGGQLRMYYDIARYGTAIVATNALPPGPPFVPEREAEWRERIESVEPFMLPWLEHRRDSPYWRNGSIGQKLESVTCPVLIFGGWADGYPNPPLRMFEQLGGPKRVIVGPWNHSSPNVACPGPRIDHLQVLVEWLDRWCRDQSSGAASVAPIAVFEQEWQTPAPERTEAAGRWRGEEHWPPPGLEEWTFFPTPEGALVRSVATQTAGASDEQVLRYEPASGLFGGLWSGGYPFGLPGDQRADEALSLAYTTSPLERNVTILGRPVAHLRIRAQNAVATVVVRLADVGPGGASHLVSRGALNATRRLSMRSPEPLVPGELYDLEIPLDTICWKFRVGHRVRLSVAAGDFPNLWPPPSDDAHLLSVAASRVVLPVVPNEGSAAPPSFEPSPLQSYRAQMDPMRWTATEDNLTGVVAVDLAHNFRRNLTEGVERSYDYAARATTVRDKPWRASMYGRHSSAVAADGTTIRSTAAARLRSDESRFHLVVVLEVVRDGVNIARRRWRKSFERDLM